MTDNQQPGPTGENPTPQLPEPGQQPYPQQQVPGQQYPPQQYPGQPYPAQQYPSQQYPAQQYPGQQYPAQQYAGQPYPSQYQQGIPPQQYPQGFPSQQYPQQPYPGQQQPARKGKGGLILGITGGVVVLGLIAVFALPRGTSNGTVPVPVTTTAGGTTQTAVAPSATGAAAVQGYLEAIASGDSASALSYGAKRPLDQSLLTDEVLAANRSIAPITDITTTEGAGGDHQTVQAGYQLGGTPVSTTFEVTRVNGTWLLDAVAAPLPLDLSGAEGIDLTINGTPVVNLSPAVFPGRYTVAAASGWYKLSGGTVQVENVAAAGQAGKLTLSLSSSGVSAIRKAAQSKLTSCVRKKSLAPAGCAFNVYLPGGNKVRSSSIHWRLTSGSNAMKKLKPSLDVAGSAIARVSVKSRVDCSSTNGRRWRGYGSIHYVYATLSDSLVQITFGA